MTNTEITSSASLFLTGILEQGFNLNDTVGGFEGDFDMDAANGEYEGEVAAIIAGMRPAWSLVGDSIICDVEDRSDWTDEDRQEFREALSSIDTTAILEKHTT